MWSSLPALALVGMPYPVRLAATLLVSSQPRRPTSPISDQPTLRRRAKSSTQSAAAATLLAGSVMRVASSRARAT